MYNENKPTIKKRTGNVSFVLTAVFFVILWQATALAEDVTGIYTNIAGVKFVEVNQGWNIVCLPLIPCPLANGELTAVSAGKLSDSSASWVPDEFAGHYVRVSNGLQPFAYFITSNTETELTVSKGDPQSDGVTATYTYDIRPNLEEIFGGVDGPLTAGDGLSTPSDEIVVWDAAAQKVGELALLRDVPGTEFQGWLDLVWSPSELDIDADMGFWVRHHGGKVLLPVYGRIRCGACGEIVEVGWNLLGVSMPCKEALCVGGTDQTELDISGCAGDMILYPADQIATWDSVNQKVADSAFLSCVTGYEGWLDIVWNPSAITIAPGEGFWYWAVYDFVWLDLPPYL